MRFTSASPNLLRREIRSRLPAHQERVGGRAVRERRGRDGFATGWEIRRSDVVVEFAERGRHRSRVNALGFLGKAIAIGFGKVRREFRERLQQRAGERIGGSEIGDLLGQVA